MRDCHVQSTFTDKNYDSLDKIAAGAKAKGIDEITVTELLEIIDGNPSYAFSWHKLGVKRASDSTIFDFNVGVEFSLEPDIHDKIARVSRDRGLDYACASTNKIEGKKISDSSYFVGKNKGDLYRKYFEHVLRNVEEYKDCFDAYAKLDQIIRYGNDKRFNYDDYADLIDAILEVLVKNDKGLEVCTLMSNDNNPLPMPYMTILRRYKDLGGKIITLGSGVSKADDLGKYFDYACDVIEASGFNEIATYHRRIPDFEKVKSLRR